MVFGLSIQFALATLAGARRSVIVLLFSMRDGQPTIDEFLDPEFISV
jgi:hypothetical protein